MLLRGLALAYKVVLELLNRNYGALLVRFEAWMSSLNTDFGLMYELLLITRKFSGDRIYSPPAKVLHSKVFKTHSCEAGTCKNEPRLAAEDHHVDTDIELTI